MVQISSPFARLLVLSGCCLFFGSIFFAAGSALASAIYGVSFDEIQSIIQHPSNEQAGLLKFLQFFNSAGLFLIPSLLFALIFFRKPFDYLRLNRFPTPAYLVIAGLVFICGLPLLNWLVAWNAKMALPSFLEGLENWFSEKESYAESLTQVFLSDMGGSDFWVNFALIAILPPIAEELLFRGLIQRQLSEWSKSHHVGIWVAAFLFSAIHLQFYGFLPRLLLGALLGYLLVWSQSLWLPIFAHFMNNALALIGTYYFGIERMEEEVDQIGTTAETSLYLIFSALMVSLLLFGLWKIRKQKISEAWPDSEGVLDNG